jgi:hypothetical protein
MSFAFIDDWEDTENGVSYERTNEVEDGKEVWIRHVKRIVELFDVSIVTHPAYEQTSVGTREASDGIERAIEAQIKGAAGNDSEGQQQRNTDEEIEQQKRAAEEKAMQAAALRRRQLLNM